MLQTSAMPATAQPAGLPMRSFCLTLVWLSIATSGLVLIEPAPTDALGLGLLLLLPMVGLVAVSPSLVTLACLALAMVAAQLVSATQAPELGRAVMHTLVTLHLVLVAFAIAAFVAARPPQHARLVLHGWLVAALLAAACGIAGYFELVPGAAELFTRHERAAGTFKDPNVFGPFLIVPLLGIAHLALTGPARRLALLIPAAAVLMLALLLSFSRGAWMCLAVSLLIWGWLTFASARPAQRTRLIAAIGLGIGLAAIAVLAALQHDDVARLLEMRASLTQSYDEGPDGRFGGQLKALALIAESPLGIGSLTFSPLHHHEEAHNVYLSMAMNAGWLGGGLYLLLVVLTIAAGFGGLRTSGRARPYLIIALAAFSATVLEGLIIDSDHWRHFYLQMALIWGLAARRAKLVA